MSLFSSAFATTAGAGPSYASSSNTKPTNSQKKRKRPSLNDAGAGDKDGQIRSTTANLQKLMKKVEGSKGQGQTNETKHHKGEGRESMGSISKKVKAKGQGSARDGGDEEDLDSPRPKAKGKAVDSPAPGKKAKGDQKTSTPKKEASTPTAKKASGSGSGIEPAELPLPHTIKHEDASEVEGLTKMQRDMKAKLEGARFRWINEQLYSTPSTEAVEMMQKDPKIFSDYHLTHRALTSAWPSPPLPHIISLLSPLPARTVIADLGCGDAGLAKALVPEGKIVLSYDLVGDRGNVGGGKGEGWVVESDFLSSVPLPGRTGGHASTSTSASGDAVSQEGMSGGGSGKKGKKGRGKGKQGDDASEIVDVVVCCLSLMGTNWIGGIYEACRILKLGGTFHIAEVTSRFVSTESFTSQVESFGFELVSESSPSTHFTLFEFTKVAPVPQGAVKGEKGWEGRIKAGGEILRPCVYKKR